MYIIADRTCYKRLELSPLCIRLTVATETAPSSTENRLKSPRTSYVTPGNGPCWEPLTGYQARQLEKGDTSSFILGVMIESNLVEGRQDLSSLGPAGLKYGQSITDACLSWEMTVPALDRLRKAVQVRRAARSNTLEGN
jgi:hypothetical protein